MCTSGFSASSQLPLVSWIRAFGIHSRHASGVLPPEVGEKRQRNRELPPKEMAILPVPAVAFRPAHSTHRDFSPAIWPVG